MVSLGIFELIQTFINLHILEMLLNPSVGILVLLPSSVSCGALRLAVDQSDSAAGPKSGEHVVRPNRVCVAMACLSNLTVVFLGQVSVRRLI